MTAMFKLKAFAANSINMKLIVGTAANTMKKRKKCRSQVYPLSPPVFNPFPNDKF